MAFAVRSRTKQKTPGIKTKPGHVFRGENSSSLSSVLFGVTPGLLHFRPVEYTIEIDDFSPTSHQCVIERRCQPPASVSPRLLCLSGEPQSPIKSIRSRHAVECSEVISTALDDDSRGLRDRQERALSCHKINVRVVRSGLLSLAIELKVAFSGYIPPTEE